MKRGTTPTLPVRLRCKNEDVETIIFIFKQQKSQMAPCLLTKEYPDGGVIYNEELDCYDISFTQEDTWLFAENEPFYMDTKITLINGKIPETPIVTLRMHSTLFEAPNEEATLDCIG